MKPVYWLATEAENPVPVDELRATFESEEVQFLPGEQGYYFVVRAEQSEVRVSFQARTESLGWSPSILTGTEESHARLKKSKGFYQVSFQTGAPTGTVAVFEALWTVRTLLDFVEGVVVDTTSFKLHTAEDIEEMTELEFDIRDHMALHAVETGTAKANLWVHTHGMAKFGVSDVELFFLGEDDVQAAEKFFHELCTDLAFGQGPGLRAPVTTSVGEHFQLVPSDEGRENLGAVNNDLFEGHEGPFWTVVSLEGRHTMATVLAQYRGRFDDETPEEADKLERQAQELLPAFKSRFLRKGLMEPLVFLTRAPFEVHPNGPGGESEEEQLWVEVINWENDSLIGRVVDGGQRTTEWRKGSHVEIDDGQINALAISRESRTLEFEEMKTLLLSERPM